MKISRKNSTLFAGLFLAGMSQAALVGEWSFEDGLGTDTSGNGYHATVVGSPVSVSGVEAGTDAFIFDGDSGNYLSVPTAAFSGIGTELSIAMWTFGDETLGVSASCSGFGCSSRDLLHSHTPWSNGALYWDAGTVRHNYSPDSADYKGKWNHMVFTINTATGDKRVYINGVQDSPDWNTSGLDLSGLSSISHFYIGRAGNDAKTYYGILDEFQLYDHALTSDEVANLYAAYTVDSYATAIIEASETSGAAPLEVIFDGSGSSASGEIISYAWDFGDGGSDSGAVVTNTFAAGNYTSELVIATSDGLYSTSTVAIAAYNYVGVDLAVTAEGSADTNLPSFYTDDLGQTAVTNITGEGTGSATSDTQPEKLFNGSIGDSSSAIGTFVRINNSSSVTLEFDVSENTLGYDITEISTIFGWGTLSGGRSNQGYGMKVTFVDGSEAILTDAQDWAPNTGGEYFWTKVTFAETNGLPMARGVKSITWTDFTNANSGGDVVGREFDVLGSPSTADYIYAGIAASTLDGPPPLEVAFDGTSSYSSDSIVSYAWNFGDGNTDTGAVVTNTYAASGDYTAQLIVTDGTGASATNTVSVDVYDYVTAEASASVESGVLPLEVVFVGTNSSSSGAITSYAWDFGDGGSDSGAVVTNTYMVSGYYTATLTVTDSNGLQDSTTIDLEISKSVVASYIQYSEQIYSNTVPVVSTNDLAQTAYLSSEGTGGNESAQHAQLFNGLIGNQDGDTNDEGEVRLTSGETITVTFDTSVNTLGYDIDMIETYAGWTATLYDETVTNNASRSNQGYELIIGFADGTFGSFAGPEHWEPNGEDVWTNSVGYEVNDTYWTKVGFKGVNGNTMLRNVESITFDISNNAQAGGVVIYREFDVFGTASTGYYPNSIVIESSVDGDSLTWASDGSYTYSVQSNLNLGIPGGWGTFTNVVGTPPETSIAIPEKTEDQMFIRVIVE